MFFYTYFLLTVVKNFENIEVYAGADRSSSSLITSFSAEDSSESEQTTGVVFTFLYDIREMNKYEIKALYISKMKGIWVIMFIVEIYILAGTKD